MLAAPFRSIHFVKPDLAREWSDIGSLREADVDGQAMRFRGGANNWIVQTFLHLREPLQAQGYPCTIGTDFIPQAVNIAHRDSLRKLRKVYTDCYVVGVRADRAPLELCDFEILQNIVADPKPYQASLPLWPQPGLMPRDASRGTAIQRIAYFGRTGTVAPWLRGQDFQRALAARGVSFEVREDRWFDYSDVDLVLAHRLEAPIMLEQKPASKLINAWLAGTPALLGEEPAFSRLRKSDLDYVSIDSASAVLAALDNLQQHPVQFAAMVENGRQRALSYDVDGVRDRWLGLITSTLVPAFERGDAKRIKSVVDVVRLFLRQKAATRRFQKSYEKQRRELGTAHSLD